MDWTTHKYFVINIDNNIIYLKFNYLTLAKCQVEFCNKAYLYTILVVPTNIIHLSQLIFLQHLASVNSIFSCALGPQW